MRVEQLGDKRSETKLPTIHPPTAKHVLAFAREQIPDANGHIEGAADNSLAIKLQRVHTARVALEHVQALVDVRVPDAHGTIVRAADDVFTVKLHAACEMIAGQKKGGGGE